MTKVRVQIASNLHWEKTGKACVQIKASIQNVCTFPYSIYISTGWQEKKLSKIACQVVGLNVISGFMELQIGY